MTDLEYALLDWLDKPHRQDRWNELKSLLPEHFSEVNNPFPATKELGIIEQIMFGAVDDLLNAIERAVNLRREEVKS